MDKQQQDLLMNLYCLIGQKEALLSQVIPQLQALQRENAALKAAIEKLQTHPTEEK